jgi:hypothetical protein
MLSVDGPRSAAPVLSPDTHRHARLRLLWPPRPQLRVCISSAFKKKWSQPRSPLPSLLLSIQQQQYACRSKPDACIASLSSLPKKSPQAWIGSIESTHPSDDTAARTSCSHSCLCRGSLLSHSIPSSPASASKQARRTDLPLLLSLAPINNNNPSTSQAKRMTTQRCRPRFQLLPLLLLVAAAALLLCRVVVVVDGSVYVPSSSCRQAAIFIRHHN